MASAARPSRLSRVLHVAGALAVLASARSAAAQPDLVLRDADAPALAALLRADVARTQAMHRGIAQATAQVRADLAAGSAAAEDPLAYVQARTSRLVVPPDARYDAECSRAVSAYMLSAHAVYAIGTTDDATAEALRQKGTTPLSNREIFELIRRQLGGPAGRAQAATMKWYQARGFRIAGTVASSAPLRWGGPTTDPIAVSVHMLNAVAQLGASCERLGNRAVLVLTIDETVARATGRSAAPAAPANPAKQADAAFEATLARVGVSQERYAAMLGALWQAQRELADPSEVEQSDAMARIPGMQAMGAARRQNRAWLARHRDELLPLLEEYGRALGGS